MKAMHRIQTGSVLFVEVLIPFFSKFLASPTQMPAQNRAFEIPLKFYNLLRAYYDEDFSRQFQNYLSNRINIPGVYQKFQ